jgi:hypothetical protein
MLMKAGLFLMLAMVMLFITFALVGALIGLFRS